MTGDARGLAAFELALDEMVHASDRLLATVDGLSEDDVHAPSALAGWSRAHVLTHLARHADGLANLAHWARTGEERQMYPGGYDARNAAIEEGAGRQVGDLRLDLNESSERLLAAFADFPEAALPVEVETLRGATFLGWELPLMRIREVEIHHVDLAAGYAPDDWTDAFATRTLDQLAPQCAARGEWPVTDLVADDGGRWTVGGSGPPLAGSRQRLLAWLVGRSAGDGLRPSPPGAVPAAPRWI